MYNVEAHKQKLLEERDAKDAYDQELKEELEREGRAVRNGVIIVRDHPCFPRDRFRRDPMSWGQREEY